MSGNPTASVGGRLVMGACAAGVALAVLSVAVPAHLRRACVEMDTPYIPICPAPEQPATELPAVRERVRANPGDATAWTKLLTIERSPAVLQGAALTAPNHSYVARWRAATALQGGRTEEGIGVLIQLLRYRSSPESARIVAQLAASSDGLSLLRPHLASASEWLLPVLSASVPLKQPANTLLPLVNAALEQGAVTEPIRQYFMQMLKTQGQWLDAYGLWLVSHKEPVPLLYNASFDLPPVPSGFDWEYTREPRNRSGLVIDQEPQARRGYIMHVEFVGRSFAAPVLRQYVFLQPGAYILRGEYTTTRLRSEQGLVWTMRCLQQPGAIAGRSGPLADTGGAWRVFQFDVTVPANCGPVASLELEPAAAYEAAAGMKGHVSFDAFSLKPGAKASP